MTSPRKPRELTMAEERLREDLGGDQMVQHLSLEEVAELERLEKAASHDPWFYGEAGSDEDGAYPGSIITRGLDGFWATGKEICQFKVENADAPLIAALRNAAPALIAAARERERWEDLRRAVAEMLGQDKGSWPSHDNAPLAIAASFKLEQQRAEAAEARVVEWESAGRTALAVLDPLPDRDYETKREEVAAIEATIRSLLPKDDHKWCPTVSST